MCIRDSIQRGPLRLTDIRSQHKLVCYRLTPTTWDLTSQLHTPAPVSYTHLDVYKRQGKETNTNYTQLGYATEDCIRQMYPSNL